VRTIFTIFGSEEYRRLKIQVSIRGDFCDDALYKLTFTFRGHRTCEFMHDVCIAEIYRPAGILTVWVYLHSLLHSQLHRKLYSIRRCVIVDQVHSKSVEIGTSRKPVCNFSLQL